MEFENGSLQEFGGKSRITPFILPHY